MPSLKLVSARHSVRTANGFFSFHGLPSVFQSSRARFQSHLFKKSTIFGEVLLRFLKDRQHTVAMHHLRAGGHRIGDICPFAGFLKVRQSTVEHLVGRIEEVNIAYAGKISP